VSAIGRDRPQSVTLAGRSNQASCAITALFPQHLRDLDRIDNAVGLLFNIEIRFDIVEDGLRLTMVGSYSLVSKTNIL
jgi:hypothetical protein